MRDLTTTVSAFVILAVLLTGVYLARQQVQEAESQLSVTLPDLDTVEAILNSLLSTGISVAPPPSGAVVAQVSAPTATTPSTSPTAPSRVTAAVTLTLPPPSPTPTPETPTPTATPSPTLPPPPPTPVGAPTPTPVPTPTPRPRFPYTLLGPVRHDNACPGDYIFGVVRDARGNLVPGVTVRMQDEYGNGDTKVTKSAAVDLGRYDFVIGSVPRRVYVWVVDEGGNPVSPRVEILHLLPNSGYEAFHCHYVDWQRAH